MLEEKQIAVKLRASSLHPMCVGKTVLVEMLCFVFYLAGRVTSSCVFGIRRTRESRGKRTLKNKSERKKHPSCKLNIIALILSICEM